MSEVIRERSVEEPEDDCDSDSDYDYQTTTEGMSVFTPEETGSHSEQGSGPERSVVLSTGAFST